MNRRGNGSDVVASEVVDRMFLGPGILREDVVDRIVVFCYDGLADDGNRPEAVNRTKEMQSFNV